MRLLQSSVLLLALLLAACEGRVSPTAPPSLEDEEAVGKSVVDRYSAQLPRHEEPRPGDEPE